MPYVSKGKLENLGRVEPFIEAERRTAQRVGDELLRRTVEHTPVAKPPPGAAAEWLASRKRLPGTLKASWRLGEVEVIDNGRLVRIEVYTRDEIAPFVEYPTLPHLIVPRRPGGLLRFWNELGRTVYATIVHHTGTRGSYMLATAAAEVALMWREIGAEELEKWAREQERLFAA